ncbi:hypothetical protein SAMN02799624_01301 [Paenibacillus sp. UNC496MF]|uniref:hypothetical protein n=1 Tax=Paenibacillus sp. UNC496MF TaxID=1502753 RepID=UPI0008E86E24|nr:hypothetical protein [Paenibacillus sp. UNC496MF]SFI54520.1 hypothetical protein SAMN02799624_01301 [Paenibacillus sp. UNC496MF]
MRTIYENYRGFTIFKQTNNYNAVKNSTDDNQNEIVFCHRQLGEVLNTVDKYIEE